MEQIWVKEQQTPYRVDRDVTTNEIVIGFGPKEAETLRIRFSPEGALELSGDLIRMAGILAEEMRDTVED